ncbi:hypothetical protein [Nonomuraea rubra]|uniref:Uncharacterized protein n=1 Tax=Nonomuraea rubra TaxID=46180 RepID=A0A7X0NNY2_9ACTN|nr:hypothetical protein [Nonomuraea rubra]MBB6546954.1 hypothetical protein [Nonomuraea rubra]
MNFHDITFGDTVGAGSFVIFTRLVGDSHLRGVRGGNTRRRVIFFDADVRTCSVRDFYVGATLGATADSSVAHLNAAAQEAVFVTALNVTISGLEVRESVGSFVLNAAPAAEGLTLTGSRLTAAAFRVNGPRTVIPPQPLRRLGRPLVALRQPLRRTGEPVRRQHRRLHGRAVAHRHQRRLGADCPEHLRPRLEDKLEGGDLYAGACFGNSGLDGIVPNHLPMGGGALHADGGGLLYVEATQFTSDTDCTVGGSQD